MANEILRPWDFVEKYYPNYSSSDQIAQANDLDLIISGEEIEKDSHAYELLQNTYKSNKENAKQEHDAILLDIYERAIIGYIEQTQTPL